MRRWEFDLQLFARQDGEEPTEDPTPRKRRKMREEGHVFQSKEVLSVGMLFAMFLMLWYLVPHMSRQVQQLGRWAFTYQPQGDWDSAQLAAHFSDTLQRILSIMAPIFTVSVAVAMGGTFAQTGFVLTPSSISPDLNRINPLEGAKKVFSLRGLVNLLKAVVKISAVGYVGYVTLAGKIEQFAGLLQMPLYAALNQTAAVMQVLVFRCLAVLAVIGIADYFYERSEFEKQIRMTPKELKEERKETEGDPQIRSRRRSMQQQAARQRMMSDVPDADVVVTNPTEYAVALQYEMDSMEAPKVVAKGRGLVARRIRKKARACDVAVHRRPPLARALYQMGEVGEYIPPDLYKAVAEVLAEVWKAQSRSVGREGAHQ